MARNKINNTRNKPKSSAIIKDLPKVEKYIGRMIKGDLAGKKVSNSSLVEYYKGLV